MDISPNSVAVYKRNFPKTRFLQRLIETLSPSQIACFASHSTAASRQPDAHNSQPDLLLMSPPCQPFTRLGHRAGLEDTRCVALAFLIAQLSAGALSPRALVLENVLGFESSSARARLLAALTARRYRYAEAALNPLQFGVPNSRPRYYLLAVRSAETSSSSSCPLEVNSVDVDAEPRAPEFVNGGGTLQLDELQRLVSRPLECSTTLGVFLSSTAQSASVTIDPESSNRSPTNSSPQFASDGDEDEAEAEDEAPPNKRLNTQHETETSESTKCTAPSAQCPPGLEALPRDFLRHYSSLEVVHAGSRRSGCVTHGYGGSVRGSGPLVSPLVPFSREAGDESTAAVVECERLLAEFEAARVTRDAERALNALAALRPRLLTPQEISALLCFPSSFCVLKKRVSSFLLSIYSKLKIDTV